MDSVLLNHVLSGALAMACVVAALFFFRFWRDSRDRLFAFFALAFLVFAANRVAAAYFATLPGRLDHVYWVRFFAFALILVAIVDKNRSPRPPR